MFLDLLILDSELGLHLDLHHFLPSNLIILLILHCERRRGHTSDPER